jgi:LmbE family N-acetylglucosaminyl deacetylase
MKNSDFFENFTKAAVIVAHPDDETLWSGGTILSYPNINWTILALTRKSDPDRAPKFFQAVELLNAAGFMSDLDDSLLQQPLSIDEIKSSILNIMCDRSFDLIITHNIEGEYTRHLRHEEVSKAVNELIEDKKLKCKRFLNFAYEDGQKKYLPKPRKNADLIFDLPQTIFARKKNIIIDTYGFSPDSFEGKVCSNLEAFNLGSR